jgi:hypothetical protein
VFVSNLVEFLICGYSFKVDLAYLRSLAVAVVFCRLFDIMEDWIVGDKWARLMLLFSMPPVFLKEVYTIGEAPFLKR